MITVLFFDEVLILISRGHKLHDVGRLFHEHRELMTDCKAETDATVPRFHVIVLSNTLLAEPYHSMTRPSS